MDVQDQIESHIASLSEPRRGDMQALHRLVLRIIPGSRLWFLDGRDAAGKVVSNPNIGYGFQTLRYADGKTRDFYQIGLSANTTGTSVYILGVEDRKHLAATWGKTIGKASVTGYCVKFKTLDGVNADILEEMIRYGVEATSEDRPST